MTTEITGITQGYDDQIIEYIALTVASIDRRVAEMDRRVAQMEAEWRELLAAWTGGGLRGMRTAASAIRGRH